MKRKKRSHNGLIKRASLTGCIQEVVESENDDN